MLTATFGTLEDLIDKGVITGPKMLTQKGRQAVADLRAYGFNPTPEETAWAMHAITSQKDGDELRPQRRGLCMH